MWVKNPSRVPGRSQTAEMVPCFANRRRVLRLDAPVRHIPDQEGGQHCRQDTESCGGEVSGAPTGVAQHAEEWNCRQHLAQLPADAGQLTDQGHLAVPEPVRNQAQHGDERERISESEDATCGNRGGQGLAERQCQLAGRHQDAAGHDHHP
jgi:hypothetical protein